MQIENLSRKISLATPEMNFAVLVTFEMINFVWTIKEHLQRDVRTLLTWNLISGK
jgi:hypothetical protein